ncbi:MAG TPA: glycosyltransferase, partial [Bacteroidetes bacterium]|nr:glycosyltransferase [Bacteroidota bacterium]
NAHYIEPLTRFTRVDHPEITYDLLAIISGPEPQRTIFEQLVVEQVQKASSLRTLIVQGKSETDDDFQLSEQVRMISHLDSSALNNAVNGSGMILARPGYSTIMDLAALGKRAVLVPTPGQTEQEYLAGKFMKEKVYYSEPQDRFDLVRALQRARDYEGLNKESGAEKIVLERVRKLLA